MTLRFADEVNTMQFCDTHAACSDCLPVRRPWYALRTISTSITTHACSICLTTMTRVTYVSPMLSLLLLNFRYGPRVRCCFPQSQSDACVYRFTLSSQPRLRKTYLLFELITDFNVEITVRLNRMN